MATLTQVRILASDDRRQLEKQINALLKKHKCANVRFLQLMTNGDDAAYAVLVAWDEEEE